MILDNTNKRALTISEAAQYACVSRGTIYNWLAAGLLPYELLPGRMKKSKLKRIRIDDLQAFLDGYYRISRLTHRKKSPKQLILQSRTGS